MAKEEQQQKSLFPTRDSVEAVLEEAKSQLPIQDENTLVTLLRTHENTINSKREPVEK